jgi:hypothetical protein
VPQRIEDGLPQGAVLDFASRPIPESPVRAAAIRSFDERERRTSDPIRVQDFVPLGLAGEAAPYAFKIALAVG